MRKATALVVGALLVVAFQLKADDKADAQKLVGTWTVSQEGKNGKLETAEGIKGKQVRITRDSITCTDRAQKTDMAASYTVDTSTKPWTITLTPTEGEHKGKTLKGIVRMESDDTLEICFSEPDQAAPTEFKAGEHQRCFTLKKSAE